jgi:Extracellular link domain
MLSSSTSPMNMAASLANSMDMGTLSDAASAAAMDVTTSTSSPTNPPQVQTSAEVFNIGNNAYTYEEAQDICSAYGAQLATYDQIEAAYNNGGEWCNYGWSDGQMAYFPTQKSTWNRLQQNTGTKNACGRPGINGGYMANPNIRFGANCYGVKPPAPSDWTPSVIGAGILPDTGPTDSPKLLQMKAHAQILGFNNNAWTEY